jgi:hypothetical protein
MSPSRIPALLFLSCAVFLSGCHSDDDEPTGPQNILTVEVDALYGIAGDTWIFATDENGELLDAKPYAAGQTVSLSTSKRSDKINVTFFRYNKGDFGTDISFNTWVGVATGTTLHFVAPAVPSGDPNPQSVDATIKVSNYASNTAMLGISYGEGYALSGSLLSGNLEIDLSFYDAPADILLYGWRSDVPVYNWAMATKANDVVQRDFNTDFTPYPHQVKLNFEGKNLATVSGYDAKKSRMISLMDTYWLSPSDHPTIGYLDGYDFYQLWVMNSKPNGSTNYYQKGAIDFSFEIPTYTFSLTNSDMQNFSFNFSHAYTYRSINWQYTNGTEYTWWTVNAASGQSVKGLSIPPEIAAKYPQLDMNKFTYSYISFNENLKGPSYLDFMPGVADPGARIASEGYVYSPSH